MITKKQLLLMSFATGVDVANLYYSQPILNAIAKDLHVSHLAVGNLTTFSQVGYGLGLFFLTPLGDKVERRALILTLHFILGIALLGLAFSQNISVLYIFSLLTGILAAVAQIIIPMAAMMSKNEKGKVVGTIFSGLLGGILLARTLSGYITDWFGNWHYIFIFSALLVFLCFFALAKVLPSMPVHFTQSYFSLLKSSLFQFTRFSILRRNTLLITIVFGIFCSFWTTLTFRLSQSPFNYNSDIIGLFGILAIAGVVLAPKIGKAADKVNPFFAKLLSVIFILASVVMLKWYETSIWSYIIATIFIDLGMQTIQISNLAQIYALDEKANSRINTAYMSSMFVGGAFGTFIGVYCWQIGGWEYVTNQLLILSLLALSVVFYSKFFKMVLQKNI